MRRKLFGLVVQIGVLMMVSVLVIACSHGNVKPEVQNVDSVKMYTIEEEIQCILRYRKEVMEYRRVDSIFLSMPEPILVSILTTHGVNLKNEEIVSIYERNKGYYNKLIEE